MYVVTSPYDAGLKACTHGAVRMAFRGGGPNGTRLARLYQRAPMRALFPRGDESGLTTAVLVTTTGGLVGGDRLDIGIVAEEGSAALVSTQAAEKVYRSLGANCDVKVELSAAAGSWLEWLPHETILFEGARLDRTTRIEYAPGASILAGEMLVFGRRAHGEKLTHGSLRDSWEVRRQGRLVWADALQVAGDIAAVLAAPACLAGAVAVATAIYVGVASDEAISFARDLTARSIVGEMAVGVTFVAGVLVCRWLGREARQLRAAFGHFWAAFREHVGGLPPMLPRVWNI